MDVAVVEEPLMKIYKARKTIPYSNRKQLETLHSLSSLSAPLSPVNREHSDAGCLEAEQPVNGQGQGKSTSASSRPALTSITETADSFNSRDSRPGPPCVYLKDIRKEKREDDGKSKQRLNNVAPKDIETCWDEGDAKENAAVPVSSPLLENVGGKGINGGGHNIHAADQGFDSGLDDLPLPNPIAPFLLSRCASLSASSPSLSPSHTAESDQDLGAGFLVLSEDEDSPLIIDEEEGEEEEQQSENGEYCENAKGKHEQSDGGEPTSDKSERSIEEHSYQSRPPSERHVISRDEKMHEPEKIPWKRARTEEERELSETELSFKRPRFKALGLKEVVRLTNGQTVTATISSEDKKTTAVNAESDSRDLRALKTTLVEKLKMEFEKRNMMKKRAPPADGKRGGKEGNVVKLLKDEEERPWSPEERLNMETIEKKPAANAERNRTDKTLALQKVVQKLVGVELKVQLIMVDCGLQELRDKLHNMEYEGFTRTLNVIQGKIAKLSSKALNASYALDACAGLKKLPVPLTKEPHLPTRSETAAPAMPAIPSPPTPTTPVLATPSPTTPTTPVLATPVPPTTPVLATPAPPTPVPPTTPVFVTPAPTAPALALVTTISVPATRAPDPATHAPHLATRGSGTATPVTTISVPATRAPDPATRGPDPATRGSGTATRAPVLAIVTHGASSSVTTNSVTNATIAKNPEASAKIRIPQRIPSGLSLQSIRHSSFSVVPRPVPCPSFSAPALLTTCPSSNTQTIPVNALLPATQSQILSNNLLPPSILIRLPAVGPATRTNLPGSQLFPLWLTGLGTLSQTTSQPTTTTTTYLLQKSFSSLPTLLTVASSAATPSQMPPSPSTSSPTATSSLPRIPACSGAALSPVLPAAIKTTKEPSSGRGVHSIGVSPSEAVVSSSTRTRAPATAAGFVTTPPAHYETSSKPKQSTVVEQSGSMSALAPAITTLLETGILTVQTPVVSGCAMPAPETLSKTCETAQQPYSTKSETVAQASGPVIDLTEEEEEDVQFVAVMQKASETQSTGTSILANLQTMVNSVETPTTSTTSSVCTSSSNRTNTAVSTRAEVGPPNQVRPRALQSLASKSSATTKEGPPPPPSTSTQTATTPPPPPTQITMGSTSSPHSPCPYTLPPTPEFLSTLPPEATHTCPPQRPLLRLARDQLHDGLVLSWSVDRANESGAPLDCYQLYACHHDSSLSGSQGAPGPWAGWKKIGEVVAKSLPMACTLSHFVPGTRYYYAVRARDVYGRYGSFSEPQCSDDAVAVGTRERLGVRSST